MAVRKRSHEPEPDVPSKRLALDTDASKTDNETPIDSDAAGDLDVAARVTDASEPQEPSQAPAVAPPVITSAPRGGSRGRGRGSRGGRGRGRGRGGRWATRAAGHVSTPRSDANGDDASQSTQTKNGEDDGDGDDGAEDHGVELVAQKRTGRGRLPGRRGKYGPEVAAAIIRVKDLKGCFKAVASAIKPYLEELNKRALEELKQDTEASRNQLEEMAATQEIKAYLSRRFEDRTKEIKAMTEVKLQWAARKNEGDKYLVHEKWRRKLEAAELEALETLEGCLLALEHTATLPMKRARATEDDIVTVDGRILPTDDERSLGARGHFQEQLLDTKYTHSGSRTLKPNELERFAAHSRAQQQMGQQITAFLQLAEDMDNPFGEDSFAFQAFAPSKSPNRQARHQIDPELLRAVYNAYADEVTEDEVEEQEPKEVCADDPMEVEVEPKRKRTRVKEISTPTDNGKTKEGASRTPRSPVDADKVDPETHPEKDVAESVEDGSPELAHPAGQQTVVDSAAPKPSESKPVSEDPDREAAALNALLELKGQNADEPIPPSRPSRLEKPRESRPGKRKRTRSEHIDGEGTKEVKKKSRESTETTDAPARKEMEESQRPPSVTPALPQSRTRGKKITDLLNAPQEPEPRKSPTPKTEPKQQSSMKQWHAEPTPTTIIHQGTIPVSTFSIRTEDGKYNARNGDPAPAGIATQTVFSLNPNDPSLERASEKATKRGKTFWQAISKGAHGSTPPPPPAARPPSPDKPGSAPPPYPPAPPSGYQFHAPQHHPPTVPGSYPPPPPGYNYALPPPPGHAHHHMSPPPPSPQTSYWRIQPPGPPAPYWMQYPPPAPSPYNSAPSAAPPSQGSPPPSSVGPVAIAPHPTATPSAPPPPPSPYNGPQYGGPTILPAPIHHHHHHHHHIQQMSNHHHHTIPGQQPLAPAPPDRPPSHPSMPGSAHGIPGIAPSPVSGAPAFAQGGSMPGGDARRRRAGGKRGRGRGEGLAVVMDERGEKLARESSSADRRESDGNGQALGARGNGKRGRGGRKSGGIEVTRFKSYEPPVPKERKRSDDSGR